MNALTVVPVSMVPVTELPVQTKNFYDWFSYWGTFSAVNLLDRGFQKKVHKRLLRDTLGRTQRINLVRLISEALPDQEARVLDIGCGNGLFSRDLMVAKPNLQIVGAETVSQSDCLIPCSLYDGKKLPFSDKHVDYALLINVLHHADDPALVLSEAARVARNGIIVKDHYANTSFDFYTLVAMEKIGNAFTEINQPHNFFSEKQWDDLFAKVGLKAESVRKKFVSYNPLVDLLIGRNLHFIAKVA